MASAQPINPPISHSATRRYVAGIGWDIFKAAMIVVAGVVGLFASDRIISALLPAVLENGVSLSYLVILTVLIVPKIIFVALPVAVLVAVYFTFVRRREDNELTVLAGAGRGSLALVRLTLVIGVVALGVSHLFSGSLEPAAERSMARATFDLEYEALRKGEFAAGKFYSIGGYTVFAQRGHADAGARGVFMHHLLGDGRHEIVIANRAARLELPGQESFGFVVEGASVHKFGRGSGGGEAGSEEEVSNAKSVLDNPVFLNRFFLKLPISALPDYRYDEGRVSNRSTLGLLKTARSDKEAAKVLGERLLRAIMCFLAPLLALAAVAFTTRATQFVALPAASGIVMCASFFGPRLVGRLADLGNVAMFAGLTGIAAVCVIVLWLAIRWRESGLLVRAGVRI